MGLAALRVRGAEAARIVVAGGDLTEIAAALGAADRIVGVDSTSLYPALARRPLASLSGGQRHRAHLARALAQLRAGRARGGGRYLLLDEPTASLDLAFAVAAMQAVRGAAMAGAGVAVVLHDLDLAAAFADRIALMEAGRILACDRPARVLTEARLTAVYATPVRVVTDARTGLRVLPIYPPHPDTDKETPPCSSP